METGNDAYERFLELSRFWVQRVLVPILVFIGAGGNIVTVMVLTRRRMRCSTNIYLTALAVADFIYLLFVLILSFEHYPNIHDIRYELYWRFYGINHWLADTATFGFTICLIGRIVLFPLKILQRSSTSIWLVVCFTVERYIAVCHPIRGKVLCTENRAKRVIAAVSVLCILATISTSFEYQLTTSTHCLQKTCAEQDNDENVIYEDIRNTTITQKNNGYITELEKCNNNKDTSTTNNIILEAENMLDDKALPTNDEEDVEYHNNLNKKLIDNFASNMKRKNGDFHVVNELNRSIDFNDTGQNTDPQTELISHLNDTLLADEDCCVKRREIQTEPTLLGRNTTYRTIFYWFTSITFTFLPLSLIATFNCFLVNAVRKSQVRRKQMTKSQDNCSQAQEHRMTLILISVVILFLICQTPTASMLIYTTVNSNLDRQTENLLRGLGNVFNLLVSINAACNFLLYCALSDKYRRTFKALFCQRRSNRKNTFSTSNMSPSSTSSIYPKNGIRRNHSAYVPRKTEEQSLTSLSRAKTMITRPPETRNIGKIV